MSDRFFRLLLQAGKWLATLLMVFAVLVLILAFVDLVAPAGAAYDRRLALAGAACFAVAAWLRLVAGQALRKTSDHPFDAEP
ncbi:MAG TPA: hypothetical protein VMU42_06145 [Candidatus Sulfotelmatobacter sp.]|nr:hypothetical protein [Candidatus Sulfotelmatobacter sp.]